MGLDGTSIPKATKTECQSGNDVPTPPLAGESIRIPLFFVVSQVRALLVVGSRSALRRHRGKGRRKDRPHKRTAVRVRPSERREPMFLPGGDEKREYN